MTHNSHIKEELADLAEEFAKYYQTTPKDVTVQIFPSGVVCLAVNDNCVEYFFNSDEFIDWVLVRHDSEQD